MDEKTPPPSEAQQQAEVRRQSRAADFKAVFGVGANRTEAQARVLSYLESFGSDETNSFNFKGREDGLSIIAAGIHLDGAKSVLRVIHRNLSYAETPKPEKLKVKATSKR